MGNKKITLTFLLFFLASCATEPSEDLTRNIVFHVGFDENHPTAGNTCQFNFTYPDGTLDSVFVNDTTWISQVLVFTKGDTVNCSLNWVNEDAWAKIFLDDSLWNEFSAPRSTHHQYFQAILP